MASDLKATEWAALVRAQPELVAIPLRLRDHATEVRACAADTLYRIGARPRFMLFVLEGEIRLVRRARNGAEIVLQRATAGFLAEASLDASRYHCDIVAGRDSRIVAFPIEQFRKALHDDEAFRDFWMRRLARELRKVRGQCERLNLRGAAERIEHYIEAEGSNGRLELRQTRKAWAAELGLTHEALYRALASLVRAGRLHVQESGETLVMTIPSKIG
jgi:CRP/FNR family transcriptional regulator, dissimilatory nitrate respiration regulator